MKKRKWLHKRLPLVALLLSLLLFVLSMASNNAGNDTDRVAEKVSRRIERRLEILKQYSLMALDTDRERFILPEGLPEDMVIYRYINDSLQSWANQFSIINDDISSFHVFQRLTYRENSIVSPLSGIGEKISYMDIGPKWYIAMTLSGSDNVKVIAALEIKNTLIDDAHKNENGVNPKLNMAGHYSVMPLSESGGSCVTIDGTPLFKILYDSSQSSQFFDNSMLRWVAVVLLVFALMMFFAGHRTLKVYGVVVATIILLFLMSFIWGLQMNGSSGLFSPTIYADGGIFLSLGALILTNTLITLVITCNFLVRNRVTALMRMDRRNFRKWLGGYGVFLIICIICTVLYTHLTLKSLLTNSNISMELYRWNTNIFYTVLVYLSYTGLLFSILLIIQSLRPVVKEFTGFKYDMLSTKALVVFAFICATYFTATSSQLGFKKEQNRVAVWANRLSVERDLGLEIQLRTAEEGIAYDQLISTLAFMENSGHMIQNRIRDFYLNRLRQSYNIEVRLFKEDDVAGQHYLNNIMRSSTPIASGSHFVFLTDDNGHSRYIGAFLFYKQASGLMRMLVTIESNSNQDDHGYNSILGAISKPGDINIPSFYSYAKYKNGRLMSYKGNFPYPTYFNTDDDGHMLSNKREVSREKGHVHFINPVSENELIIISRSKRGGIVYFISFSYLFLILSGLLTIFAQSRYQKKPFRKNYFKNRINTILFTSSILILISMTAVSVFFVYTRNEENMSDLMSSRITTIQALIERQTRTAKDWQSLNSQEFSTTLENIGSTTKSDITLYTPGGTVFLSTTPEVFEQRVLGSRINYEAYFNIYNQHQRFFIHREKIAGFKYWAMYAPIFNDNGQTVAIIGVPYTDRNFNFEREAFFHAALIINLFILLLIASLLFSTREVNSLFSPLMEMGKKMKVADIHDLKTISYNREDEISSLVEAYNRMVGDLSESTRLLAQAERDKAWSQMARQVAHEIKNPLTPIKLQLQWIIRLKQMNNPAWEEKFNEVSKVILEHIDILTETANEFSTFAKLYSEDPVLIDLDLILKDQLLIFDNRENVKISYIGMEKAFVMAPKPQLIRVFVNLITNAVQAVEMHHKEAAEDGTKKGRVLICLRKSTRDGFYDVVVEDNGHGVKEENLDKLFTPNFTTKSSGTGLGLAICRNIIEKCDGEIRYQKSHLLGGASFIVTLPVHEA